MTRRRATGVLLTLGRLPVALELARAFAAHGCRVWVAEPYRWPIVRVSRCVARTVRVPSPRHDPDAWRHAILSLVAREDIEHVQPVSEETAHVVALRAALPAEVTIGAPDLETYTRLHDKWRFAAAARAHGFDVPAIERGDQAVACDARVVKPRHGCSGRGVRYLAADESLAAEFARDDMVVQARVDGAPRCTLSIARAGRLHETVAYRPLLEYGSVAVRFERIQAPSRVVEAIGRLVAAHDYTGLLAFDFIEGRVDDGRGSTDYRWWVIECNPRSTSGLHLIDAADWTRLLLGMGLESPLDPNAARPPARRQEAWSVFTVLYGRMLRGEVRRRDWRDLLRTSDVSFRRADPLPFVLSPFLNLPVLWRSLRSGVPIVQLMTEDLTTESADSLEPVTDAG